jgi:hypothetical protein
MAKLYTILSGIFVQPDGTRLGANEVIELDDDVSAQHAHQLQAVEGAVQASALAADVPAKAPVQTSARAAAKD